PRPTCSTAIAGQSSTRSIRITRCAMWPLVTATSRRRVALLSKLAFKMRILGRSRLRKALGSPGHVEHEAEPTADSDGTLPGIGLTAQRHATTVREQSAHREIPNLRVGGNRRAYAERRMVGGGLRARNEAERGAKIKVNGSGYAPEIATAEE